MVTKTCETCPDSFAKIANVERRLSAVETAFPTEDFAGHKRYHEQMIERNEELRRLRRAIQEKTVAGLLWAAIVWLGIAALHEIQRITGH